MTAPALDDKAHTLHDSIEQLSIDRQVTDESGSENDRDVVGNAGVSSGKKKKKKKRKAKKSKGTDLDTSHVTENGGGVPPELVNDSIETSEDEERWVSLLGIDCKKYHVQPSALLEEINKPALELLYTPSCRSLELRTPRLKLRTVEGGDSVAVRKIKTEPTVQRTQIRYISTGIPRLKRPEDSDPHLLCRDEYVFAITAKDPSSLKIQPPGSIKIANRISTAEGYLGNIAIKLDADMSSREEMIPFSPVKGKPLTQPTFAECDSAKLVGKMYYELHPQLWGQGIVSEAFAEVLRFGFEELGCTSISADPTTLNQASIKLCLKNGLRFVKLIETNSKPQLWHEISRKEWWDRNRPGKPIKDSWGGKEICRWCLNPRLTPPKIQCSRCSWARYCSRECQRADWVLEGGHEAECDLNI